MPRPDELPPPATIPPYRRMPTWGAVILSALLTVGLIASGIGALSLTWFGLGPIGSAATFPRMTADGSSEIPLASSARVTPVTFAEVATLIAMSQPPVTPGALAVYLADVTPTPLPTPLPATATYEALMQAARDANATATAAARPRSCYESPPGRVCIWPSPTATLPPPLPTLPPCETPVLGELCVLYGAIGDAPRGTPLPVILDVVPPARMPR